MNNLARVTLALASCAFAACTSTGPDTGAAASEADPALGGKAILLGGGELVFIGPFVHGTATAAAAPVYGQLNPTAGTGTFGVTIAGTSFHSDTAGSLVNRHLEEASGDEFVVLWIYEDPEEAGDPAVEVIVRAEDVVPGAVISLDGQDRLALVHVQDVGGTPDESREAPVSRVAAAVSGQLTLSASSSAEDGGTISATLDADFGEVDVASLDID